MRQRFGGSLAGDEFDETDYFDKLQYYDDYSGDDSD